jgi:hypothetical protein
MPASIQPAAASSLMNQFPWLEAISILIGVVMPIALFLFAWFAL